MRVLFSIVTILSFTITLSQNMLGADARRIVGGFSPADTGSEEIDRATKLILQNLEQGNGPIVSFSSELNANSNMDGGDLGLVQSLKAVPLEASKQVVAGMNFKIKVGIFIETTGNTRAGSSANREVLNKAKHKKCIGGISVTVYRDLKGDYSVSSWGSEIECDQVVALLNENKGEE